MGIVIPSDTELLAEPEKFRLLLGTLAKALKPNTYPTWRNYKKDGW